ncbi:MAG: L-rhamnonate dehydratase [Gammaproteobacteria bacterium]|nr:L-rhamnonate dehydratase [Gammaproteobacteria bacterium]
MIRNQIVDVRAYTLAEKGAGGEYHDREQGHWLVDTLIANPMSKYPDYKASRTSWGIGVLGSIVVEIETDDGTVGVATGLGGEAACFLIERHFRRFLIGQDPRDIAKIWDQMYCSSLPYGRKGLPLAALSVVDIALWDVLGLLRDEPVYKLIGGATRGELAVYQTGAYPDISKKLGFIGGKVPLPHGPADGPEGLRANVKFLVEHRERVGPEFKLKVDCYMSLDVPYAVELAHAVRHLDIYWLEECLSPDDIDGHKLLKARAPFMRWTTGEHEYSRYGFRQLIADRAVDIIQPDVMWVGGLTELLRISAMAAAYDMPVVPHGSGAYSYHFVISQPHCPFCEYINTSPGADQILPVFGALFTNEVLPKNGAVRPTDDPGWGLKLNRDAVTLHRPYTGDAV